MLVLSQNLQAIRAKLSLSSTKAPFMFDDCVLSDNVMNIVWTRDYIYGSRFFCLPWAPPILSATLLVHAYTCIYSTVLQFLDEDTWIALAESRVWLVAEPRASAQHTRF